MVKRRASPTAGVTLGPCDKTGELSPLARVIFRPAAKVEVRGATFRVHFARDGVVWLYGWRDVLSHPVAYR